MGLNEAVALEANFSSWKANRFPNGAPKDVNLFEYYCVEQFLRPFDISDTELKSGMVGGHQDGGVDAMYMFVSGELVDAESELDPKADNHIRLLILQVKEGEGFSPNAVDKLFWFIDDLLDLTRKKAEYHSSYRAELITLMRLFKDKYGVIVGENPSLAVEVFYITKKDVEPNEDCEKSAEKIKAVVKKYFSHAQSDFHFVNAPKLWTQVQARPSQKKPLKWASQPMTTQEGEIGLVNLSDYYSFLKEANGRIAERIFDSNVRGYWQETPVNKRIAMTLREPGKADFWLLNNGITILAEKIDNAGYLQVDIHDPQIVNGLQTSRQIFNYFKEGKNIPPVDIRRILVRVIKTADKAVRDDVILCTNSQNKMPEEALRATDAIHRQIETLFHTFGLFYDRRKGHYRDQGKSVSEIVSLVEVLQAMLSVVIKRPDDARGRPRNYFKNNEQYALVFGADKYSLNLYLKSTQILRRVAAYLDTLDLDLVHRRNVIFYLCMYVASASTNNSSAPAQMLKLDAATLTDQFIAGCFDRVWKLYQKLADKYKNADGERDYDGLAKGKDLLNTINTDLKRRFAKKKSATKATSA
jgi:hypothetical protein